jgi:glutamyl-tRNA reductase
MPRRRYRPLFIIDIAVPRDVEPSVGELENIYLFDIDDLGQVVETNLKKREAEARDADAIVEREAEVFFGRLRAEQAKPTIVRLRTKLTRMKDEELERALGRLSELDDTQRERVARLANTLVNRILHEPSVALKKLAREGEIDGAVDIIHTLFQLDASEEEPS